MLGYSIDPSEELRQLKGPLALFMAELPGPQVWGQCERPVVVVDV